MLPCTCSVGAHSSLSSVATHRISIFGVQTIPDSSGKVTQEPLSILGTNDAAAQMVYRIDEDYTNGTQLSTKAGIRGGFSVPKNYVGTPKIIVLFSCTKTAGDVVLDFDYKPVAQGESVDPAALNATDTATVTVPGTAHHLKEGSITLSAEALAANDWVEFYLAQDGVAAGDTLAGALLIHDALFEYADA